MKKLLVVGVVGMFVLSSCKKDYTCACTATDSFWNISYTAEMKKKDAETWCDNWQSLGAGTEGWKCELK